LPEALQILGLALLGVAAGVSVTTQQALNADLRVSRLGVMGGIHQLSRRLAHHGRGFARDA
jgi:hypothetical protein